MDQPYIELNAFMKIISKASTGGQAKQLIRSSVVKVNGEIETRNRKKMIATDIVEYEGKKYVVADHAKLKL